MQTVFDTIMEQRMRPELGFRVGEVGTHTARTIMLSEVTMLFEAVSADANNTAYRQVITEDNVLGKKTVSTRRLTAQRLSELYGLDSGIVLCRVLRRLWDMEPEGRPLLGFLCAIARDPLLRMTAPPVLNSISGDTVGKAKFETAISEAASGRFNPGTKSTFARNAASSWTQSGHLSGRVVKKRSHPKVTPAAVTYALFLAWLCGYRGQMLFENFWVRLLDTHKSETMAFTQEASRRGLLLYRGMGEVVQVDFPGFLTDMEREYLHE